MEFHVLWAWVTAWSLYGVNTWVILVPETGWRWVWNFSSKMRFHHTRGKQALCCLIYWKVGTRGLWPQITCLVAPMSRGPGRGALIPQGHLVGQISCPSATGHPHLSYRWLLEGSWPQWNEWYYRAVVSLPLGSSSLRHHIGATSFVPLLQRRLESMTEEAL